MSVNKAATHHVIWQRPSDSHPTASSLPDMARSAQSHVLATQNITAAVFILKTSRRVAEGHARPNGLALSEWDVTQTSAEITGTQ